MEWPVRIISGKAGRIEIRVPKGVTRPTTDFMRQAVFSILGVRVQDERVLDLFAGSGALGLEALSRGAASCVFVESHRGAEKVLTENLAKSRLEGGRVVKADVHRWVERDVGHYDLIFADPPYAKTPFDRDHLKELFEAGHLAKRLAPEGLLVIEQSVDEPAREGEGLKLLERREYGGGAIVLYAQAVDS
ncbi:MAG: 16S rRNA (guanine(966)-N(2))-methyltransferase RsmD [Verrucomicrobiota bacterium]